MSDQPLYADVLLPVPIPQAFTYRVPHEWGAAVVVGMRVLVEFGPKGGRVLTGIVSRLHHDPPPFALKYLLDILDTRPTALPVQLRFWEWIAQYYVAPIGDVMQAAVPAGLKLSSQSLIQLNPEWEGQDSDLSDQEYKLLRALQARQQIDYEEASKILEIKHIHPILKSLIAKRVILLYEQAIEKYKPKKVRRVRIHPQYMASEAHLSALLDGVSKHPKQEALLLRYITLVPVLTRPSQNEQGLEKSQLMHESVSASAYETLIKKGVLQEWEMIVSRMDEYAGQYAGAYAQPVLSAEQQAAAAAIAAGFGQKDVMLLHGVTGSGKTEVYIHLIQAALEAGGQVLLMLPEIALTTQIVVRMRKVFGEQVGVYHSRFSEKERVEVWKGVLEQKYSFVIGVRSSIFLPFSQLGLVIVDEEHEPSYKQYDPSPRYHARDAAIVLAGLHKAKVLLGSATPAVETYYLALTGRYGLAEMLTRYGEAQLPEVKFADLRVERKEKRMRGEFSQTLLDAMADMRQQGRQTILFQNRRGYAPYLSCQECGWTFDCHQCAVSLVYHLSSRELRCHYCGHHEPVPRACLQCGSSRLHTVGMGTQKIEEELQLFWPDVRAARMDLDTTRSRQGYQQIIERFEQGDAEVLIGTQMVSKGLDFEQVGLVGIFDIDRMLHYPDFRTHERAFQLISQVGGRAGRRRIRGEVLIQTHHPHHPLLAVVASHDYRQFYEKEIIEREKFAYPPFTRLIQVTTKHREEALAMQAAMLMATGLTETLGKNRVLGPQPPVIARIRNEFLYTLTVKIERDKVSPTAVKDLIRKLLQDIQAQKAFKELKILVDVDPV